MREQITGLNRVQKPILTVGQCPRCYRVFNKTTYANQIQKPAIQQHAFEEPLSYTKNMRNMLKLTASDKSKNLEQEMNRDRRHPLMLTNRHNHTAQ